MVYLFSFIFLNLHLLETISEKMKTLEYQLVHKWNEETCSSASPLTSSTANTDCLILHSRLRMLFCTHYVFNVYLSVTVFITGCQTMFCLITALVFVNHDQIEYWLPMINWEKSTSHKIFFCILQQVHVCQRD